MNYADRFKIVCVKLDERLYEKKIEPMLEKEQIKPLEQKEKVKPIERLYDVYKRSLPPMVDQKVVLGVTKEEVRRLMDTVLKAKVYRDVASHDRTIIYFDEVAQDASESERSIYFNKPGITI